MSSDGGPGEGSEREAAAGEAWHALYQLVFEREGQQRFHEACDAIGLAPGGLKALLQLSPDQPTPMRDLAEFFRCDPSYVTSLVDGLEAAGLAERRSHPTDRRVKMVALSRSGEDRAGAGPQDPGPTADVVLGLEHTGAAAPALAAGQARPSGATTKRLMINALGVLGRA